MYYDRRGNPMTLDEWGTALETDRRVLETTLPDGKWVSTIWLGLDLRCSGGPPLIFETMIFPACGEASAGSERSWGNHDLDCTRYTTEAEAVAGHAAMVAKWSAA